MNTDQISAADAVTLPGLFRERVRRSGDAVAYKYHDVDTNQWLVSTWSEMAAEVNRWHKAFINHGLQAGDRVALMVSNCREWVIFDQAAMAAGLVVVPLYTNDRAENISYITENSDAKVLLIEGKAQWVQVKKVKDELASRMTLIALHPDLAEEDSLLCSVDEWLPDSAEELPLAPQSGDDLASIVYTSGTTGRPKGVMLSHRNFLWNIEAGLEMLDVYADDLFLSFLPMSHVLERSIGYYLNIMSGASVAFSRSVLQLGEDLVTVRPTLMVSVPRIFERIYDKVLGEINSQSVVVQTLFRLTTWVGWRRYERAQGRVRWTPEQLLWPLLDKLVAAKVRDQLGGQLRFAVCGGAPLPPGVAKLFLSLGVVIIQGYGLTEHSPVICVNTLADNVYNSAGIIMSGVETKVGDDEELMVRSPSVMQGYWKRPDATQEVIDDGGWLRTGDKARIDGDRIYIVGRIKEIIVLGNGEKVPPADMEMAIEEDPLFDQVLVLGEGRAYLSALVVLNWDDWQLLAAVSDFAADDPTTLQDKKVQTLIVRRIAKRLEAFPGYAKIRRVALLKEPWTVENELLTPTLKTRRKHIIQRYADQVASLYDD